MKKRIFACLLLIALLLSLCSCSKIDGNSTFNIEFIDVGQGDAALVECDGHYMLIDGGNAGKGGNAVYNLLVEKGIQRLDILAISHLHEDHFAGLIKALEYVQSIKLTICNAVEPNNKNAEKIPEMEQKSQFGKFKSRLIQIESQIIVPPIGKQYSLGSAKIEVLDNSSIEENDSLVLLVTYGNTKFLFTGDIGDSGLQRLSEKFQNNEDKPYPVDVLKMPHHGAYSCKLTYFLRTFMPDNVIISVGADNSYKHPDPRTLDKLDNKTWTPNIYRTDLNGNITVTSNGKRLRIVTTK